MARHYIGFTPNGARVLRNVQSDPTGDPLLFLDEGETRKLTLDFTAYLDSGETISSVASTSANVTVGVATSSPTITLTLSAASSYDDGYATLTLTLSTGVIIVQTIYVRRPAKYSIEPWQRDYA